MTVNLEEWMKFIDRNYSRFLKQEFNKFIPNKVYTILLGTFISPVYLESRDSVEKCLIDTINSLLDNNPKCTILIKPHAISSEEIYKKIIKEYTNANIYITFLHPAVLSKISKVVICNYYSTAIAIAKKSNVTTIEYTNYSEEALKISNGGSMRPDLIDHFINKDKIKLMNTLKQCNVFNEKKINYPKIEDEVLDLLS